MFFLGQIIMILVAYISAKEEVYATYPYRENIAPRGEESKEYHFWGSLHTVLTAIILAILTSNMVIFIITLLWYWLIFDIIYAIGIGKPWYYLGQESLTDRVIIDGKKKAFIVIGVIVLLNVITYLWIQ